MKKFIQICSLFSLLVLFTVGAATAQSGFGSDVEIPFAFNVGDHSYEAGNYVVKLTNLGTGSAALSIRDEKTDEVQTVLLNAQGDDRVAEIKLVFDMFEGRRYLTKISTPSRTYAVVKSRPDKNITRVRNVEKAAPSSVIGGSAN